VVLVASGSALVPSVRAIPLVKAPSLRTVREGANLAVAEPASVVSVPRVVATSVATLSLAVLVQAVLVQAASVQAATSVPVASWVSERSGSPSDQSLKPEAGSCSAE
jgi:hypothetical protein